MENLTIPYLKNPNLLNLLNELKQKSQYYVPELNTKNIGNMSQSGIPSGGIENAIFMSFIDIYNEILVRLNLLPTKNFIEFLNLINLKPLPQQSSQTPVMFKLSEKAETDSILINLGTNLSVEENQFHPELNFSTTENILVTKSSLVSVHTFISELDIIVDHNKNNENGKPKDLDLFQNYYNELYLDNSQKHELYIGHSTLFHLTNNVPIIVFFEGDLDYLETLKKLIEKYAIWEYSFLSILNHEQTASDISEDQNKIQDKNWIPFENIEVQIVKNDPPDSEKGKLSIHMIKDSGNETKSVEFQDVFQHENRWIRCRLDPSKIYDYPSIQNQLNKKIIIPTDYFEWINFLSSKEIQDIEIKLDNPMKSITLIPKMLFFNDIPIDPTGKLTIYPLGRIPKINDSFYIESSDAFSKKGYNIEIDLVEKDENHKMIYVDEKGNQIQQELRGNNQEEFTKPDLSWEYWNGNGWTIIDNMNLNQDRGIYQISFICPEDISPTEINGHDGIWIRTRLIAGEYGKAELVPDNTRNPTRWEWSYSNIHEPRLEKVRIRYFSENSTKPEILITNNNLQYAVIPLGSDNRYRFKSFIPFPFTNSEEKNMSFFLGFDKKLEKGPIMIYFSISDEIPGSYPLSTQINQKDNRTNLEFYYLANDNNSTIWKQLQVEDNTFYFDQTGFIKLYFPDDFLSTTIFGKKLYWLKVIDRGNKFSQTIVEQDKKKTDVFFLKINGIYPNSVYSINGYPAINESLNINNTGQYFTKHKPVSVDKSNTELWVNENNYLNEETKSESFQSDLSLENKNLSSENVKEKWTKWTEVENLYFSKITDRHYTLDRNSGEVNFGTQLNKSFVGEKYNKIKLNYFFGGGKNGNIETGEIKSLKTTIPFIESVTNIEPAQGGRENETLENITKRGSFFIKNRGRAVTTQDFEEIIKQSFPSIDKIKCFANTNQDGKFQPGNVCIVIVPNSSLDKPLPSNELLRKVKYYLEEITSNIVVSNSNIFVIKPLYIKISVMVDLYPISVDLANTVQSKTYATLENFLHPLHGGFSGDGWEFGRTIYESDIYSKLQEIPEVNHIRNVKILKEPSQILDIPKHSLIYSGNHNIRIKFD